MNLRDMHYNMKLWLHVVCMHIVFHRRFMMQDLNWLKVSYQKVKGLRILGAISKRGTLGNIFIIWMLGMLHVS